MDTVLRPALLFAGWPAKSWASKNRRLFLTPAFWQHSKQEHYLFFQATLKPRFEIDQSLFFIQPTSNASFAALLACRKPYGPRLLARSFPSRRGLIWAPRHGLPGLQGRLVGGHLAALEDTDLATGASGASDRGPWIPRAIGDLGSGVGGKTQLPTKDMAVAKKKTVPKWNPRKWEKWTNTCVTRPV